MKPTNHSHVICPKCGHRFSQPQPKSELNVDKRLHALRCISCNQPITSAPLSFCGGFACEACVVAYYQQYGPDVVKQELRERTFSAARLLRPRRKL
jgi:primosomal protein N'